MIKAFLQRSIFSYSRAYSKESLSMPNNHHATNSVSELPGEGKIFVSAKSLIALRLTAQNLPLRIKKIKSRQSGQYYSPFKGRGMEFDEVRPYQAGDDVRNLDWRVTARTGKAHTKLFREERERSVLIWMDFQRSMYFGTRGCFKTVIAAKAAAHIAWSALKRGDRLGYMIFNEGYHLEKRPAGGKVSVLHFLKKIADATKNQGRYDASVDVAISPGIQRLRQVALPGSKIILLSDFRHFDDKAMKQLASIAKHNDVVLVFVYDRIEKQLPDHGIFRFSENDKYISVDTGNKKFTTQYTNKFIQHQERLQSFCKQHSIHFCLCSTESDIAATIGYAC